MLDELLTELNSRMQKAVDGLARELATIRAGRATPALLDNITVDYQGASIPLFQLATISIPEANLIIIQPWDRTSLRNIERAILTANIGLNPANDGNIIRVVIPPLSEERRKEVVKLVSRKVEERRIAIRNIRRDGIERLREMEKAKETYARVTSLDPELAGRFPLLDVRDGSRAADQTTANEIFGMEWE